MCTQGLSTETTKTLKCCLVSYSLSRLSMCTRVSHTFTSTQNTLRKDCMIITTSHFPSILLPIIQNFIQTLTHKVHKECHTRNQTHTHTHTHTHRPPTDQQTYNDIHTHTHTHSHSYTDKDRDIPSRFTEPTSEILRIIQYYNRESSSLKR